MRKVGRTFQVHYFTEQGKAISAGNLKIPTKYRSMHVKVDEALQACKTLSPGVMMHGLDTFL